MIFQDVRMWVGRRESDFWVGLFFMILSVVLINEAIEFGVGSPSHPGSGFMILGASVMLGVLAINLFVQSIPSREPEMVEGSKEKIIWGRIVVVIAAKIFYIIFFNTLGYLLSTFFFLSILFQVMERGRWAIRLVVAALTSLLTYLFFARLLQLGLPKGVFPLF